eukprot:1406814-Pleurochrysis_carterae.AAC.6
MTTYPAKRSAEHRCVDALKPPVANIWFDRHEVRTAQCRCVAPNLELLLALGGGELQLADVLRPLRKHLLQQLGALVARTRLRPQRRRLAHERVLLRLRANATPNAARLMQLHPEVLSALTTATLPCCAPYNGMLYPTSRHRQRSHRLRDGERHQAARKFILRLPMASRSTNARKPRAKAGRRACSARARAPPPRRRAPCAASAATASAQAPSATAKAASPSAPKVPNAARPSSK